MPYPVPSTIDAQLHAINAAFEESFKAGDMTRLVETAYHKHAKALPQGAPIVSGASNIAGMFQSVKDKGVDRVQLTVTERYACDKTAQPDSISELGAYIFYSADGKEIDNGKYLVLWAYGGEGVGYKYASELR